MGALWMESYGQIYPELKKLTEEKMISLKSSIRQNRVMHKEYSLIEKGREALLECLKEPAENKIVKQDILLKLFFAKHLKIEEFEKHLNNFKNDFEEALQNLLKMKETLESNASESKDMVHWYLTALFGETVFNAYIDWAEKALEILKKLNSNIETE